MTEKACPYAKSDTTPCVIRDGIICYVASSFNKPICVGCERSPKVTGVPVHASWEKELTEYKAKSR